MSTTRTTKTSAIAGVAAIGLIAAGCSGGEQGGDDGVIRVQVEASKLAGFEAVAELFEAGHDGQTIAYETITSDQKSTTNALTLAAGDAPDLGLAPINATSYGQLLDGGALLPLDDVWEASDLESRYDASTVDSLAPNGSTPYSVVPETQLYNIVYYNTGVFADAGIEIPESRQLTTNDELFDIVDALHGADTEAMCIGGTSNYQLGWLFDGQLATSADSGTLAEYLISGQSGADEVDYDTAEVQAALQSIQDWSDNGLFQAGMLGQDYDTALANFSTGTCGAILGTATTVSALDSNGVDFDVDWFLLPGIDGPTLPNMYTGSTLVIPQSAANSDGAKDFLEFLMTTEAQIAYVEGNGTLPAVNDVDQATLDAALPELVNSVLGFVEDNGADLGWTSVVPGEMGQAFIDPAIQGQLNGDATVAETSAKLQANYLDFRANQE